MYETIDFGLIPAETKNSINEVLIFVYPDLKSSPTTKTPFYLANSITPGKIVFYGEPLIYEYPSMMVAKAKMVDGEISGWLFLTALIMFSAVSWIPSYFSVNLSVEAVQSTIILSN